MHASVGSAAAIGGAGTSAKRRAAGLVDATPPMAGFALPATLKALEQTIKIRNPAVISVDLFDTILLRGTEPQRVRWLTAADRAAKLLSAQGIQADAPALLAARLTATRAAMALTAVLGGPDDVSLDKLFTLTVEALGLPLQARAALLQAELAEERTRLAPNVALLALLANHRADRRIVITSDTNFSAAHLAVLLDHFGALHQFDTIRTSADFGLTKQTGTIFPALVDEESVHETRILHIGDDEIADVQMPSRFGIAPFHIPRPTRQLLMRRSRKFLTKVLHGDR